MKLLTHQIGRDTITVHNNFLTGIETVYFNGEQVARAFNWFQGTHYFRVRDANTGKVDNFRVDFVTSFRKWYGVAVDIYKNGDPIVNQSGHAVHAAFTVEVQSTSEPPDAYDRRPWYDDQPAPRSKQPVFREEDLV